MCEKNICKHATFSVSTFSTLIKSVWPLILAVKLISYRHLSFYEIPVSCVILYLATGGSLNLPTNIRGVPVRDKMQCGC